MRGECVDCINKSDYREKYLIGGRCPYHYKLHRKEVSKNKRTHPERIRMAEREVINSVGTGFSLNQWFDLRRKEMKGMCINCGCKSLAYNDKMFKWSIAHILPKNIFLSVRVHPLNWIELCEQCHTLFDRNLLTASKMNCWRFAVDRFNSFEVEVKETHKYFDLFKLYANVSNKPS